ncbi:MAG: uncharacterized protein KVP18_001829 [Porospora cf. gigantea A]|uniref:uncharacterized protein n=1 Tax=Porospora cf. gigantea A TaxID=2853593 RepID=UPI003559D088|nr:MAG: hypothetical protein KVP18_001829 [Porospora cf. gigantea A]
MSLKSLLSLPGNQVCTDCPARSPHWAVVNLGTLVCIDCSGQFRALGTHVCVVKSVTLDKWKPEWIDTLARVGNDRSNRFWEFAPTMAKPQNHRDKDYVRRWIEAKYRDRLFIDPSRQPPASCPEDTSVAPPSNPAVDLLGFGAFPEAAKVTTGGTNPFDLFDPFEAPTGFIEGSTGSTSRTLDSPSPSDVAQAKVAAGLESSKRCLEHPASLGFGPPAFATAAARGDTLDDLLDSLSREVNKALIHRDPFADL